MPKIEITLSEDDRRLLDQRVEQGGFDSVEEYLVELVRRDASGTRDRLRALLLEGLNSGEPFEITEEWRERKKQELTARV